MQGISDAHCIITHFTFNAFAENFEEESM
jgi:hypothetical protein